MEINPDDALSCIDCQHCMEWSEYGFTFHDCDHPDSPMCRIDHIDLTVARNCKFYQPRMED